MSSFTQNHKSIFKLLLISIAILIVAGVLVYNNLIKKEEKLSTPSTETDIQNLSSRAGFDVFKNQVFKDLVDVKKLKIPTKDRIGRVNPFLPFPDIL